MNTTEYTVYIINSRNTTVMMIGFGLYVNNNQCQTFGARLKPTTKQLFGQIKSNPNAYALGPEYHFRFQSSDWTNLQPQSNVEITQLPCFRFFVFWFFFFFCSK